MMKLLIILFLIQFFTWINVFKYVTKKRRQSNKTYKKLEQVKWHYWKVNENISFIKSCKKILIAKIYYGQAVN